MVLSQVGVALAGIGVALFEVGVARATPKVYKSPPLGHCTAKRENIGLKFCKTVGNTKLYNIYSVFWISIKFRNFWAFVFEKSKFTFCWVKYPKFWEFEIVIL